MEPLSRVNQPCRQPPTDRETDWRRLCWVGAILYAPRTRTTVFQGDVAEKTDAEIEVSRTDSIQKTILAVLESETTGDKERHRGRKARRQ